MCRISARKYACGEKEIYANYPYKQEQNATPYLQFST